jgi:hypothetical protein
MASGQGQDAGKHGLAPEILKVIKPGRTRWRGICVQCGSASKPSRIRAGALRWCEEHCAATSCMGMAIECRVQFKTGSSGWFFQYIQDIIDIQKSDKAVA